MNLPKFLDLLETGELFFCQLNKLNDAYEGALSSHSVDELRRWIQQREPLPPDMADKLAEETYLLNQYFTYVNCWHLSQYESMAMWQQYGDDGIAIRSSFRLLKEALNSQPEPVHIGKVKYGNYADTMMNFGNTLSPVFHKRRVFDFEKEVRAAHMSLLSNRGPTMKDLKAKAPDQPPGVRIKVNISILIEKVYVSPGKPEWYRNMIAKVLRRYDYNLPLENSTIDKRPRFN